MLEIKNKLYQLITIRINGTNYNIESKSSIVLKDMKLSDLPEEIKNMDKDAISITEKDKTEENQVIKRKNKTEAIETPKASKQNKIIENKEITNG
jgi:hypothetical protein